MDVLTIGEMLVEFIRKGRDTPHYETGEYAGPFPSGAPAIFVDAASRLGLKSAIIGAVGDDDFGSLLKKRLAADNVDITHVYTDEEYTTGIAFVTYFSDGSRRFVFNLKRSAAARIKPEDVDEDFVKMFRVLHIMGSTLSIGEEVRESCYRAVEIASRAGMMVTYDPNLRAELIEPRMISKISEKVLKVAEIVMPSKAELFDLTGKRSLEEASEEIFKHGVKLLIVKIGEKGSIGLSRQETVFEPAFIVPEVDPTGAGDVFDAAAVYGYLKNWRLRELLEFANAAGALKVTRMGPMSVPEDFSEIKRFMKTGGKKEVKNFC
ncbi:MAG: sugar kinase [Thaumarchaeota archaeon]|jgi:sugar/nucleoside kinase (ribokinase family)|nr:sugar kinase [Nitrososphaerota archaeon]